ncbi:hypothetical protein [Microbacterium sp. Leaf320]|uniref:hypothetical protein n=1 Tax=Microbacterium sp. Leaf320 TaxID=1736334 RepID=UPI0006F2FFC9|nr:hypothetical protein [Microbacterium sp. Leaf320]
MSRLSPDTMLSITLGSICSRTRYTSDPAPVVDELLATAGDRSEILKQSVGSWVGYYEDAYTITLCTALRELPGLEPWIALGVERRSQADHRTPTAHAGASWPQRSTR